MKLPEQTEVIEWVKENLKGRFQKDLAAKAGLSEATITAALHGHNVRYVNLYKIVKALNEWGPIHNDPIAAQTHEHVNKRIIIRRSGEYDTRALILGVSGDKRTVAVRIYSAYGDIVGTRYIAEDESWTFPGSFPGDPVRLSPWRGNDPDPWGCVC